MTQNEQDLIELALSLYTGIHTKNRCWKLQDGMKQAALRIDRERKQK